MQIVATQFIIFNYLTRVYDIFIHLLSHTNDFYITIIVYNDKYN